MMTKLIQSLKSSKDKTSASDSPLHKLELPDFKPAEKIILGISGGPDSVFLLHQLLQLNPRPTIVLCHVNYHLRGWASNTDQGFVEKLAQFHHLKYEIHSSQPGELKGNLEENCRQIRYHFFEEIRQKHQASWILTAHNQDDQVETFLLNLIRGASLIGFSAINSIDQDRHLVRPILHIGKAEILNWLKTHKISFREDKSNSDLKFRRNFLRHKIIPMLREINPNVSSTLAESIKNLQDNLHLVQEQIDNWLRLNLHQSLPKEPATNKSSTQPANQPIPAPTMQFELDQFLACSPALQKKILAGAHKQLHHRSFTSHQLREILQTLQKNRAGLSKEFGPQANLKIIKDPQTQKRVVVIESKIY